MKQRNSIIFLGILLVVAASCKRTYPTVEKTSTVKMSSGWWVTLSQGGTQIGPTFFMNTYNTSADGGDSLWIDDLGNINADYAGGDSTVYQGLGVWMSSFKFKVAVQYSAETFSVTNSENEYWTGNDTSSATLSVTNGKIFPNAAHNPSGQPSDSINFQLVYSLNPALTCNVTGVAFTGFLEDQR
jgi:hypothetical protein